MKKFNLKEHIAKNKATFFGSLTEGYMGQFYAPEYLEQKYGKEMAKKIEAEIDEMDSNSWDRFTGMESAKEVEDYIADIKDMLDLTEAKKKHSKMKKSELKSKIKEMILAEMNLNISDETPESEEDFLAELEAMLYEADKEKDDKKTDKEIDAEEEIDITDEFSTEEPKVGGGINVNQNADADLTGVEKEAQDNLEAALEAAKKLGDEKLATQIGNTLTFFTKQHVVKENLNEGKFKIGDMLQTYGGGEKVKVLDIKPNLAAALADTENPKAVKELEKDLRKDLISREDRNKPFYLVTSESFPVDKYYIESELESLINESISRVLKKILK